MSRWLTLGGEARDDMLIYFQYVRGEQGLDLSGVPENGDGNGSHELHDGVQEGQRF